MRTVEALEDYIIRSVQAKLEAVTINGCELARPVLDTISVHKAAVQLAREVTVLDPEMLAAAKALLEKIDSITSDEFSRGAEKAEREALRRVLAKIAPESNAA